MGRFGSKHYDSDASGIFFDSDYAARFAKTRDHNTAWGYFFNEWSRLPEAKQDDYGVEYLLGVIELWVWAPLREKVAASQREQVTEAIEEHGPRLTAAHPGFLPAACLYALAQFEQQELNARTRARALELLAWSRASIRRLGLFGGPQSKGGKAMARTIRKLERDLG